MTRYLVYLEYAQEGPWIAHVLDLPGCFVRAAGREEVLRHLPEAIRERLAWLRRHGESAPSAEEPIEVEVAAELDGFGVCQREDKAALFPPEHAPITPHEMERYFQLMAYSRADLLALVHELPNGVLDWRPDPQSHSVRSLLRHIGSAEQWYVSRLVPPETLPSEWEDDEEMPLWEFLDMERRTALGRLRRLTEDECASVFYPTQWTAHPDEAWTARKALRRFLEHEWEHIAQIRDILELHRRHLLAGLATARAGLLGQLLSLDKGAFTQVPLHGDWVLKDALVHIAAWDRWVLSMLRQLLTGGPPDLDTVQDIDGTNAANVAAWKDRALEEVIAELGAARADWVAWMEGLPVVEFFRRRPVGRGDWYLPTWIHVFEEHDSEHAEETAAWCKDKGLRGEVGLKQVLCLALGGAREELLAAVALVPAEERDSRPVCGEWTLQDLLGHVADWGRLLAEGLRDMAAGRPPQAHEITDLDAWNQARAEVRQGQSWEVVRADLEAAQRELLEVLEGLESAVLGHPFPAPWGGEMTSYSWACIYFQHDREHAADVHKALPVAF